MEWRCVTSSWHGLLGTITMASKKPRPVVIGKDELERRKLKAQEDKAKALNQLAQQGADSSTSESLKQLAESFESFADTAKDYASRSEVSEQNGKKWMIISAIAAAVSAVAAIAALIISSRAGG